MTAPEEMKFTPPRPWRSNVWLAWVAMIFTTQLGIIWTFSGPGPVIRPTPPASADALAGGSLPVDTLALNDPSLFALSSPQGFSGPAWLALPRHNAEVAEWSEPETWVNVGTTNWGGTFLAAASGFGAPPQIISDKFAADLLNISLMPPAPVLSTLRVTGELAGRKLLSPIQPRTWPHDDVLADTVVRLTVDAAGVVQSAAVISNTGVRDAAQTRADNHALELARAARFEPKVSDTGGAPSPVFGVLTFQWGVTPLSKPANTVPETPRPGQN